MTRLPEGKTRLDLVKAGVGGTVELKKRGRFVVSLTKLIEDPRNERKTYRNMDGLIATMKSFGLIEPITVIPAGDDRYQIITGHRRYRAAKEIGLEQVEVLIREPEDESRRRLKSIISNVQREDIGPVEMAEALQALMDEDPRIREQDDLASLVGKDKAWVSGMLRILSLPPDVQQRVGCTQLTVSYDSMIRIARLNDEQQQRQLVDALLGGASQKQIREQIDRIKGKPRSAKSSKGSAAKPKRVFRTKHGANVIVQSRGKRLTDAQCAAALRDALMQVFGAAAHAD
jgi:ParB family chromosome partitioning protein